MCHPCSVPKAWDRVSQIHRGTSCHTSEHPLTASLAEATHGCRPPGPHGLYGDEENAVRIRDRSLSWG